MGLRLNRAIPRLLPTCETIMASKQVQFQTTFLLITSAAACSMIGGPTPARMHPVGDTNVAPFAAICRFETIRDEGDEMETYHSTGFLIDSVHALTAAHNFADTENDPVVDGFTRCGQFQNTSRWDPEGRLVPGSFDVPAEFEDFEHDYALVRLGSASPRLAGFRLPRGDEAFPAPGTPVHVAGYARGGTVIYHSVGVVLASGDSTAIHHTGTTRRGMSGGPVWIETQAGERVVIGVHSGALGTRWNPGPTSARRLDSRALAQIHRWIDRNDAVALTTLPD